MSFQRGKNHFILWEIEESSKMLSEHHTDR